MRFVSRCASICAAAAFTLSPLAHAASIGTLTCDGKGNSVKANVSYYSLGIEHAITIGSQSAGAGASKALLQPLLIRTSLVNYTKFLEAAGTGAAFPICTLDAQLNDGAQIIYTFRLAAVSSVVAVAQAAQTEKDMPARYTEVELQYGAIEVKTDGTDDGGTSTSASWNQIKNIQDATFDTTTQKTQ